MESYSLKEIIEDKFEEMGEHLKDIKAQTTKTNGRVTNLENHRAYLWGAFSVLTLLGGTIIYLTVNAIDSKIRQANEEAKKELSAELKANVQEGIKNALSIYNIEVR